MYYAEASVRFSSAVDKILMQASKVETCPYREKCVLLLLDEMHFSESLVYDKNSAAFVGYTDLGTITIDLLDLEKEITGEVTFHTVGQNHDVRALFSTAFSFPMHNFHAVM